jgi:hypothetical protein
MRIFWKGESSKVAKTGFSPVHEAGVCRITKKMSPRSVRRFASDKDFSSSQERPLFSRSRVPELELLGKALQLTVAR